MTYSHINANQILVMVGGTGSGKTAERDSFLSIFPNTVHLQTGLFSSMEYPSLSQFRTAPIPREILLLVRVAALSVPKRVADEMDGGSLPLISNDCIHLCFLYLLKLNVL